VTITTASLLILAAVEAGVGAIVQQWLLLLTGRTARSQRLARGALARPGDVLPALPWSCGGRWQD
jgi:hypothetical protein